MEQYIGDQRLAPTNINFKNSIRQLIKKTSLDLGRELDTSEDRIVINVNYPCEKGHKVSSLVLGEKEKKALIAEKKRVPTKMGIYMFYYEKEDVFLKIGEAGPNSDARFKSQHYSLTAATSTLSNSIYFDDDRRQEYGLDEYLKNKLGDRYKEYEDNLKYNSRDDVNFKERKHVDSKIIGEWIKQNCIRVEIMIDITDNVEDAMNEKERKFIESSLILKYNPRYEGYKVNKRKTK